MIYAYRQNNVFGHWIGPVKVFVEASNEREAFKKLEEMVSNSFCECCGFRWNEWDFESFDSMEDALDEITDYEVSIAERNNIPLFQATGKVR